jgi:hypothetical protein
VADNPWPPATKTLNSDCTGAVHPCIAGLREGRLSLATGEPNDTGGHWQGGRLGDSDSNSTPTNDTGSWFQWRRKN